MSKKSASKTAGRKKTVSKRTGGPASKDKSSLKYKGTARQQIIDELEGTKKLLSLYKSKANKQIKRLQKLTELSLTLSGDPIEVFKRIASMIGDLMDVRVVCLSEVRGDELYFLSVYVRGEVMSDAGHCPLDITPCATVEETKDFRVYDKVAEKFPKAEFLRQHNAYSYCGFPAFDSKGGVIAVICLLDDRKHEYTKDDKDLLQIFSQRIGVETERYRYIKERRRINDALRESEEKYQKLFNNEMDAICLFDIQTRRLLDVNDAYIKLYGYSKEEALELTTDDISAEPEVTTKAIKRSDKTGNVFIPLRRHRKKDGTEIVVEIAAGPFNWKGQRIMYAVARDITKRIKTEEAIKKSLKEKEVLLKEIHHRVKNNMAIISSLLQLQARYSKDEKLNLLFRDSQSRISSMALVHEKLYQTKDFANINFREYVEEFVGHILVTYGKKEGEISLTVSVDDINLNIDTMIPFGLILNELVTNSLKHAFEGVERPEISISLDVDDDQATLVYGDNGRGIPEHIDFLKSDTLGLQIVNMLALQLKGSVKLDRNDWTRFTIRFEFAA
jgi:PAS domain S-box-containing protein